MGPWNSPVQPLVPGSTMLAGMQTGAPISYEALEPGTPVFSSDEVQVGRVAHVLYDESVDIFDGIVIDEHLGSGGHRFIDSEEVHRIYEHAVILTLDRAQSEHLPEPSANPAVMRDDPTEHESGLSHKLRRAWDMISGNY
jgi:hypothetical protein